MRSKTSDRGSINNATQFNCPHINRITKKGSPVVKIESSSFKKNVANASLHCDNCESRIPKLWVCLHNRCRAVVCCSNSKHHMRNHYEILHKENRDDACHSVFANPRTLTIWCIACSFELNPFEDSHLNSEARIYLKTVIRCLQGKRNKSQQTVDQSTIDVPGLVGLKNLGITCYASAALQCLSNTPALTNFFNYCDAYIPHLPHNFEHPHYKLAETFNHFMKAMWSGKSAIFSPIQLINEIKKYNEVFQERGQQDSVEFFRCVLDRLHEELPYPHSMSVKLSNEGMYCAYMNPLKSASFNSDNMDDNSYLCGITSTSSTATSTSTGTTQKRQYTHTSVISNIFQGLLESRIKCLHCKKNYSKEDHFYDLSIQIDKKFKLRSPEKNAESTSSSVMGSLVGFLGAVRLQDCLSSFCATEKLTGVDRYECDKCKSLTDCQKTLRITQLPEILCIQLKRYRFDSYSYFSSKIATHVQFPMEDLDMKPYSSEKINSEIDNQDTLNITKYDLYGLIHHRGVLGAGHYIAYVKNPIDGNWYEYDDTYITKKSATDISRLEAYALFYQKKCSAKDQERKEILARICKDPGVEIPYLISRLWFNRWQFMTTPGPITNYDFLCKHGSVNLKRYPKIRNMVVKVPFSVYTTFVGKYGTDGSPPYFSTDHGILGCVICEKEEKKLEQRRQKETLEIGMIDTNTIKRGEFWFLISSKWLSSWHNFKSGGPPPGPINNYSFLQDDGSPKPRMKRGDDYRGVNERVWSYFEHSYGGGPICVRTTIDLYAPNPLILDNSTNGRSYQKLNGSNNPRT
ncbi:18397_t:CDS:10 [Funneliformis geosporum]|uniref:18397_t:CDS:1 n=1 Tax=Funneliformis geosporum TaxID=1117311 RepID=A0A9W4SQC0_9GLOM|nr:18397_t:CDS:10 [Funneliformis geosporum]